jgi:hypothetical protein
MDRTVEVIEVDRGAVVSLGNVEQEGQRSAGLLVREAQGLVTIADSYFIDSRLVAEMAATEIQGFKRFFDQVEGLRKSLTAPIDESKRRVMDLFRPALEPAKTAEAILKAKLVTYLAAEARELKAAQEAARRAADELAKAMHAQAAEAAAKGRVEDARAITQQADMLPAAAAAGVPTAGPKLAGISERETWGWELLDKAIVPREFLCLDTAKLNQYARAMKAEAHVAGIRFFPKAGLAASKG